MDARTTLFDGVGDWLSRLPAKDRHDLRNAIVAVRNTASVLNDSTALEELSNEERNRVFGELQEAARLLEHYLLPSASSSAGASNSSSP